jgi:hypothetical protein
MCAWQPIKQTKCDLQGLMAFVCCGKRSIKAQSNTLDVQQLDASRIMTSKTKTKRKNAS